MHTVLVKTEKIDVDQTHRMVCTKACRMSGPATPKRVSMTQPCANRPQQEANWVNDTSRLKNKIGEDVEAEE